MPNVPISRQIELLVRHLKDRSPTHSDHPDLDKISEWIRDLTPAQRTPELLELLKEKFRLTQEELDGRLSPKKRLPDFDTLVPKSGWIADYLEYTRTTEPPSVFHFFAGLVAVGSSMARNVYFRKGGYSVFPNLCVVLVAPSGKCRKTSACNLSVDLLRSSGANVISDKATPEALVEAFKEREYATGLLYAPELAVFLGKQKYMEGMIPMLTSLFDAPKEWRSLTIGRGELALTNVALSFLGASTLDWIQNAIPNDAFGGGFMSRLLFVVQEDTPRSFPLPPPLSEPLKLKLFQQLIAIQKYRGEVNFEPEARTWYETWYTSRNENSSERQFAGYSERKPDHLIRLAICLSASKGTPTSLSVEILKQALTILEWIEFFLPATFEQMSSTTTGEEHQRLLRQIRSKQGVIDHSTWLRMNSNRMNSRQFREAIDTLRAAKLVEYDSNSRIYFLTPEGWK